MKHVCTVASVLGLGALWLLPACSGETEGKKKAPEVEAEAEAATATTIHYACASECGEEQDAAPADGIPEHCDAPMIAMP